MNLEYPLFLINYKVYGGTGGEDGLAYARTVEAVRESTGAEFVVAPQTPDIRLVAEQTSVPVVAQYADPVTPGRGTGRILPETVAAAGADGVLVNHPERRTTLTDLRSVIRRCRDVGLDTIVSVDDVETGRAVASFDPDCLLLERPADISTDRALSRTSPDFVEEFVATVGTESPRTSVIVGGGVSTPADVRRARELGADGAGAASAAIGADDPQAWLSSIADALR